MCLVNALEDLLASRSSPGANDRPLFFMEDGRFLTRSEFSSSLQNLLHGISNTLLYGTHSFRICETTTAAQRSRFCRHTKNWKMEKFLLHQARPLDTGRRVLLGIVWGFRMFRESAVGTRPVSFFFRSAALGHQAPPWASIV